MKKVQVEFFEAPDPIGIVDITRSSNGKTAHALPWTVALERAVMHCSVFDDVVTTSP